MASGAIIPPATDMEARSYQNELFQKFKSQDCGSIVYLPTGSGKTFISIMAIKDLFDPDKKMAFLINTTVLAEQQKKAIQSQTPFRVEKFIGDDGVDFFDEETWSEKFSTFDVCVMSAQVFCDGLLHFPEVFNLRKFSLVVFDECHHCQSNHPYNKIMREYHNLKERYGQPSMPKILGLSASLANKKVDKWKFMKEKQTLEENLNSLTITTDDLASVLKYSTQPDLKIMTYEGNAENGLSTMIKEAIDKIVEIGEEEKKLKDFHDDILRKKKDDEVKGNVKKFKRVLEQVDKLQELGLFLCHLGIELLLQDEMDTIITYCDQTYIRNMAVQLKRSLEELRFMELLKIVDPDMAFIQSGYVVGNSLRSDILEKLYAKNKNIPQERKVAVQKIGSNDHEEREATLDKFRKGDINVIFATQVLEEGVDIRKCNLVLRFDDIPNFRSYCQSKGRARAKPSFYIIMVAKAMESHFQNELLQYKAIEKLSIEECHNQTSGGNMDDSLKRAFYSVNPNDPNSAKVYAEGAVSVVSQYIQKAMPSNRFVKYTPYWDINEVSDADDSGDDDDRNQLMNALFKPSFTSAGDSKYRCHLYLPKLVPIESPVVGEVRRSKKGAKADAALKAVKLLHKAGELNDNLYPSCDDDVDVYGEDGDDHDGLPKRGTKRRKGYYPVQRVSELEASAADAKDEGFFLYMIDIDLKKEMARYLKSKGYNVYKPENSGRKIGFLVSKQLPFIPQFTIFNRSGENLVTIKQCSNGNKVRLNKELKEQIVEFHKCIFQDVLRVVPEEGIMQFDEKELAPLFCPISVPNGAIDTQFLSKFWNDMTVQNKDVKKSKFQFIASDFEDSVLIPQHRDMERLIVEEIMFNMSPQSSLPKVISGETFKQYYELQYSSTITDSTQPLLKCSSGDKQINMLKPGSQRTSIEVDAQVRFFVPELTKKHPIPASLWREIQMLPFILNRIELLLKINHFANDIAYETLMNILVDRNHVLSSTEMKTSLFQNLVRFNDNEEDDINPFRAMDASLLVQPLTCKGAADRFDLELLEIIGDSFLKFSVGLYLYNKHPNTFQEGVLTQYRSHIVSNRNLCEKALKKDIPELLKSSEFKPRINWMPPGFGQDNDIEAAIIDADLELQKTDFFKSKNIQVKSVIGLLTLEQFVQMAGAKDKSEMLNDFIAEWKALSLENELRDKGLELRTKKQISDKAVADSVEALIGCFLANLGIGNAIKFMEYFGIIEANATLFDAINEAASTSTMMNTDEAKLLLGKLKYKDIEQKIGYKFKNRLLLIQAFTHGSYIANRLTPSYDRLEFLGDAVLDFVLVAYIVCFHDGKSPGEITTIKSSIVSNENLGRIVQENDLEKYLLHTSTDIFEAIDQPLSAETSKLYGDIFEAIIGAIYLDSGSLEVVFDVFEKLCPDLNEKIDYPNKNPVSVIYEQFKEVKFEHKDDCATLTFSHEGTCYQFEGKGKNKKIAKREAALNARKFMCDMI